MDLAFIAELENIFREEFLKAAPLYAAASKVKLPYEDIKGTTVLYRGSLSEQSRPVDSIADYELLKNPDTFSEDTQLAIGRLATRAGNAIDGLIRLENVRSIKESDPRQTSNLRVTDIFEHEDGRRNLNIGFVKNSPNLGDPIAINPGWIFYRFYFAAAAIVAEYKH